MAGDVRVFAPGKLMVIGEYAVLHGGQALVAAVDSGLECHSMPRPRGWWLTAPDLGIDAPLSDAAAQPGAGLLAAAAATGARAFAGIEPQHLTVRGRGPGTDRKNGLGGSAAATVAMLGCLGAAAGKRLTHPATRSMLFDLAFAVHRTHQGGRGSGADVAASVFGGWLSFRLAEGKPCAQPAVIPSGLQLAAAWSGKSTDTTASLIAFDALPSGRVLLSRMQATLSDFWTALDTGSYAEVLHALSVYGETLDETAQALRTPEGKRIAELVRVAQMCGVAAKGSGAVGGDCVLALGDPASLRTAEAAWRELGATVLDLNLDLHGARVLDPD